MFIMGDVNIFDSNGAKISATNPLNVDLHGGDIEIGAVEIKNGTSDQRMTVDTNGNLGAADKPSVRTTLVTHRNAIATVSKVVSPTLVTLADQAGVAGALTAVSHGAAVAAGNAMGSAGTSNILTATPTVNKTLDLTIPQATGATYYDVFCSTATTAPLWVARITEAQRAAGCAITAVGTVGAGGAAGIVNIRLVGTGIANTNVVFSGNNAYITAGITPIACAGYKKLVVKVSIALTDLRSAPALNIIPFYSDDGSEWYAGTSQATNPLASTGYPLYQQFEIDVDGEANVMVLIGTISGQGATGTVKTQLV